LAKRMTSISIDLGDRGYKVHIGRGALDPLVKFLAASSYSAHSCVTDSTVSRLHWSALDKKLRKFAPSKATIRPGEPSKCLATLEKLYNRFLDFQLDRKAVVLAFGGGVVGDLAGFAAATFMRGVDFIQVPTTLLAAVDSSVGGKTAVDLERGKNLVGAFYQPRGVFIETSFLDTLSKRQWSAGLAEVVKYGVILDEKFFHYLERNSEAVWAREEGAVRKIVARSVQLKAQVVAEDEREAGLRAILNFGHTLGHAVELTCSMLHGEAIAVGMVLAARIAEKMSLAPDATSERISELLRKFKLPRKAKGLSWKKVRTLISHDKKAVGGRPRFVLPTKIGRVEIVREVPDKLVREVLEES